LRKFRQSGQQTFNFEKFAKKFSMGVSCGKLSPLNKSNNERLSSAAAAAEGRKMRLARDRAICSPSTAAEVVRYWFSLETRPMVWFKEEHSFHEEFKNRFARHYELAKDGKLREWRENPVGALAEILLLDEYPRKAFPNTPKAFATDALALKCAKEAIEKGFHDIDYDSEEDTEYDGVSIDGRYDDLEKDGEETEVEEGFGEDSTTAPPDSPYVTPTNASTEEKRSKTLETSKVVHDEEEETTNKKKQTKKKKSFSAYFSPVEDAARVARRQATFKVVLKKYEDEDDPEVLEFLWRQRRGDEVPTKRRIEREMSPEVSAHMMSAHVKKKLAAMSELSSACDVESIHKVEKKVKQERQLREMLGGLETTRRIISLDGSEEVQSSQRDGSSMHSYSSDESSFSEDSSLQSSKCSYDHGLINVDKNGRIYPDVLPMSSLQRPLYDLVQDKYYRVFLLLPFSHSENLADHNYVMKQAKKWTGGDDQHKNLWLKCAFQHWNIVLNFKRFPGRNKILKRPNSGINEEEFLKQEPLVWTFLQMGAKKNLGSI